MAMKVTNAQPLSLAAPPGVPRLSVDKSVETDAQSVLSSLSAQDWEQPSVRGEHVLSEYCAVMRKDKHDLQNAWGRRKQGV